MAVKIEKSTTKKHTVKDVVGVLNGISNLLNSKVKPSLALELIRVKNHLLPLAEMVSEKEQKVHKYIDFQPGSNQGAGKLKSDLTEEQRADAEALIQDCEDFYKEVVDEQSLPKKISMSIFSNGVAEDVPLVIYELLQPILKQEDVESK